MNVIINGQEVPNANELHGRHRRRPSLSESDRRKMEREEQMRMNREKQKQQAAMYREKKKQSAWTHTKLETLAFRGAQKRQSSEKLPNENDLPPGGIRQELDTVGPILDEHFGEPLELAEDINLINNGFKNEKIVIDGNEMQSLDENTEGKKFLYGLLIQRHIFDQRFSISVGTNDQPILRDETTNPTPARQEQMKGLQQALQQYEFSENKRSLLRKNDNTSLTAEYIAANTYREHNDLIGYRNELYRKIGVTNNTLSPEASKKLIEDSSLSATEKSFLLAWRDTNKDKTLGEVKENQETYVKNAVANINSKSAEANMNELIDHPFTKSAQLLAGGAIGAALLYFAYKQIKKGGFWGTLSGLIMGLIGGSIMLPLGDKAWKSMGLGDALKNINEGKPTNRADSIDNPFANIDINLAPIKTNLSRLQARLAGGQEGIEILMNPKVGQKIAKDYPVYSMLGALNPNDSLPPNGKYQGTVAIPGANISDINTGFQNLSSRPDQKGQLNKILADTWERYQKTGKFQQQSEQQQRSTSLGDMLAEIQKEDGWLNTVIDKITDEPKRKEALKVIGQNPAAWGNCTLGELETVFTPFGDERDADNARDAKNKFTYTPVDDVRKDMIRGYLPTDGTKFPNPNNSIVQYLKTIGKDKLKEKSGMKLRDFLKS